MSLQKLPRSYTHLQGISLNVPSRAKHAPDLSNNTVPSALQIHLCGTLSIPHPSWPLCHPHKGAQIKPLHKRTAASRASLPKPESGSVWATCSLSSPAWKLSPAKGFRAGQRGVIYKTTSKTFHHTWTLFFSVLKGRWVWCLLSVFPIVIVHM